MNTEGQLSPAVRQWLEDGPSRAPDHLLPAVTRQISTAGRGGASAGLRFGGRNLSVALLGVAASVVLLAGITLLALQLGRVGAPTVPTASQSARPGATPTSVSATLGGPTLSWTRVQDAPSLNGEVPGIVVHSGDRFLLQTTSEDDAIWSSTDGLAWSRQSGVLEPRPFAWNDFAAWEDVIVHSSDDDLIAVTHAAGPAYVNGLGETVVTMGIGPAGIVVGTHGDEDNNLDHIDVVRDVLGHEWEQFATTKVDHGVLTVTRHDGESVEIVLSEHGYSEQDFTSRYAAWYSVDGSSWDWIRGFPSGRIKSIVGTASGFYAAVGYEMWHSTDGRQWTSIGRSVAEALYRWRDGVITDGLDYWTVDGHAADISADAVPTLRDLPLTEFRVASVGTGALGIVVITHDGQVLFSPDAELWSVAPLPDDLLETIEPDLRDFIPSMVAVSEDVVIIDLLSVDASAYWVGELVP